MIQLPTSVTDMEQTMPGPCGQRAVLVSDRMIGTGSTAWWKTRGRSVKSVLASAIITTLSMVCAAPAQTSPVPIEETFGSWSFIHVPGSGYWTTGTGSEKYDGVIVGVTYLAEQGCQDALFEYSMPAPPPANRLPDGDYPGQIEIQVDELDSWWLESGAASVHTGLSIDGTAAIYSLSFMVDEEFTRELTQGRKLWVNLVDENDDDWFDLEGAKLAIGLARLSCMQYLMESGTPADPRTPERIDPGIDRPRLPQTQI